MSTALLEFSKMIVAVSNIFFNVNNNNKVIVLRYFNALYSGWFDSVFTARFEQVNVESSILITTFENLIIS